jgi:hypothetical protein
VTCLLDHPFAKHLQECDSVESITNIFQSQSQTFREFRDDGKLIESLTRSTGVLVLAFLSTPVTYY